MFLAQIAILIDWIVFWLVETTWSDFFSEFNWLTFQSVEIEQNDYLLKVPIFLTYWNHISIS